MPRGEVLLRAAVQHGLGEDRRRNERSAVKLRVFDVERQALSHDSQWQWTFQTDHEICRDRPATRENQREYHSGDTERLHDVPLNERNRRQPPDPSGCKLTETIILQIYTFVIYTTVSRTR